MNHCVCLDVQVTEIDFVDMFGSFDLFFKEGNTYSYVFCCV